MATVGVIVTTYHQAHFLDAALSSLMAQTPAPEVIVIDDGSADRAQAEAAVAKFPGVRYHWQENAGVGAARNVGLSLLTTEYVTFLDADDRMLPGALAHGVAQLDGAPQAAWASSRSRAVWPDGRDVGGIPAEAPTITAGYYQRMLQEPWICPPSTVLLRRDVLVAEGGWCEDRVLSGADDYELYLRILRNHQIVDSDVVTVDYVQHQNNTGSNAGKMLGAILEVLDREREFTKADPQLERVRLTSVASFERGLGLRAAAQRLLGALRGSRRDLVPAAAAFVREALRSPSLLARMVVDHTRNRRTAHA